MRISHIDGIRGISIISVVIFHAFPEHFNSGYIGYLNLVIVNMLGDIVYEDVLISSLGDNDISISFDDFDPGFYVISLIDNQDNMFIKNVCYIK